jgi:AbrB family looped-hinge helix DNA binding protein
MVVVETTKMSTRGQVVIPKQIREFLNVNEDSIFTVVALDRETIVLRKLSKEKILADFAKIREKVKKAKLTRKDVEKAIAEIRAE